GRLTILDMFGRTVWSSDVVAGTQEVSWNGVGANGASAQGVYMARLASKDAGVRFVGSRFSLVR
ncbi:MAG TPA: hypothetical protein VHO02_03335, partial [Fibrobacteria bacterium]|nr:hypothetical protein [Fibrobacteria bacterium]